MNRKFQWMPALVVMLFCQLPSESSPEKWQQLVTESKKASADGDKSYACFKLRQAWSAVNDPSFTDPAYKEIYKEWSGILVEEDDFKVWKGFDQIFRSRDITKTGDWRGWNVIKAADNSFLIVATPHAFTEGCGIFAASMASTKEGQTIAQSQEKLKKKLAEGPLRIDPSSSKYLDMASLCTNLKIGEAKAVDFNLAPFIPDSYLFASPI